MGLPQDFQGVEKDVIIVSHLRNSVQEKLGAFRIAAGDTNESVRILNLTLTRARRFLWLVGNLTSVSATSACFQKLGKYCMKQQREGYDSYFQFES